MHRWVMSAIIAFLVLVVVALIIAFRPIRALKAASGLAAKDICSATFVSGIDPDATLNELVRPMLGNFVTRFVHYHVDYAGGNVTASFAGIIRSKAGFVPGYGCRLEYPDNLPLPPARTPASSPIPDVFALQGPVAPPDPLIAAALDRLFTESPNQPVKDVKAVVVVRDGSVIAERYAPGYGIETPLLGYSVAKSFTNALLGILVREGRLRVNQPVGATEWAHPGDSRSSITIEDLIRMESGLDASETGSGFDPVSQMELTQGDMAGFAARRPLKWPHGGTWEYTSANTLILDRLLGYTVGGGAAGMRDFAERELFAPMHMAKVTMEFDGRGVFVGSSYVYAPARSFARFGELYLNDGIAPDGQRILPSGWVAWSRRSTFGAPYGAGFWTNEGATPYPTWRVAHGVPKNSFYASGILGQRIYIFPSQNLVIARFGYSRPPDFGMHDDVVFIDTVLRALEGGTQSSSIGVRRTMNSK